MRLVYLFSFTFALMSTTSIEAVGAGMVVLIVGSSKRHARRVDVTM